MYRELLTVVLFLTAFCECDRNVVEINQGLLSGKLGRDRKGNEFYSFLSIPYAKSPVGDLRFRDPQEVEPWNGVLNATVDLPSCLQIISGKPFGQEDCLFLNVHTPKLPRHKMEKLFPVFFYIHGGGFVEGSGSTEYLGPEFLIPADVVVVTFNYRLGIFGFLSSKDDSLGIYGNAALKDQNMALRWVKKNIKKFGGDPSNVMIVGESAGAAAIHYHLLSPASKGLFHKAIMMSGSALNSWALGNLGSLELLGRERMRIESGDSRKIFEVFNGLPVEDLLQFETINDVVTKIHEGIISNPVVENPHPGAFLTQTPMQIIKAGNYSNVPCIIGYTNKEGLYLEVKSRLDSGKPPIVQDFEKVIPNDLDKKGSNLEELKAKFKEFYFGNEEPTLDNFYKSRELLGGVFFVSGIARVIRNQVGTSERDLFLYKIIADTELNYMKKMTPHTANVKGCSHSDDLGYIFNTVLTPKIRKGSVEDLAIDNVVGLFTNFLKTGKPRKDWLPVTPKKINYMEISVTSVPDVDPDKAHFKFWNDVYEQYGLD